MAAILDERKQVIMTTQQVIMGAIVVGVLMGLVPPWHVELRGGVIIDAGYALIADPPQAMASINVGHLLLQWAIVGGVAYGLSRVKKE